MYAKSSISTAEAKNEELATVVNHQSIEGETMGPHSLVVLTFNIWGLLHVSRRREERIAALANELTGCSADIVALQVPPDTDASLINQLMSSLVPDGSAPQQRQQQPQMIVLDNPPYMVHVLCGGTCACIYYDAGSMGCGRRAADFGGGCEWWASRSLPLVQERFLRPRFASHTICSCHTVYCSILSFMSVLHWEKI